MAQPVEHALGAERRGPGVAGELAVAADPVEHQGARKAALAGIAHVAEMAQPGKAVEAPEPVGVIDLEAKGRGAAAFDQLGGQQVPSGHHLAHGLAVAGAEFGQVAGKGVIGQARPAPTQSRHRQHIVGNAERQPTRAKTNPFQHQDCLAGFPAGVEMCVVMPLNRLSGRVLVRTRMAQTSIMALTCP
jgi:hypothetical protein